MDLSSNQNFGNILEYIRSNITSFKRSDKKVADTILSQPQVILNATLAETSLLARVSQPTVIRFCNAIGCDGYSDFKLKLAHCLAFGTPATHSVILETDSHDQIVTKIFDYTLTSLSWARQHLDPLKLQEAILLLQNAKRIEFFGFGASGIVAADAAQKFPLFGVPCNAQSDSHQMYMTAHMMDKDDVAVIISNTAATHSLTTIARILRQSGCKVLGILGMDGPIAPYCDCILLAETLDNTSVYTPTISRIAALVVIDILSTAVAISKGTSHIQQFSDMKRHLSSLRQKNPI